jgi:hypothetical protein
MRLFLDTIMADMPLLWIRQRNSTCFQVDSFLFFSHLFWKFEYFIIYFEKRILIMDARAFEWVSFQSGDNINDLLGRNNYSWYQIYLKLGDFVLKFLRLENYPQNIQRHFIYLFIFTKGKLA